MLFSRQRAVARLSALQLSRAFAFSTNSSTSRVPPPYPPGTTRPLSLSGFSSSAIDVSSSRYGPLTAEEPLLSHYLAVGEYLHDRGLTDAAAHTTAPVFPKFPSRSSLSPSLPTDWAGFDEFNSANLLSAVGVASAASARTAAAESSSFSPSSCSPSAFAWPANASTQLAASAAAAAAAPAADAAERTLLPPFAAVLASSSSAATAVAAAAAAVGTASPRGEQAWLSWLSSAPTVASSSSSTPSLPLSAHSPASTRQHPRHGSGSGSGGGGVGGAGAGGSAPASADPASAPTAPTQSAPLRAPDTALLTPRQVVAALDEYVIGQSAAKRAVAIALRNRWRRRHLPEQMQGDIVPKNILMVGPTGCGKTEIARRLAKLADAPFIKVEATKFTETGFHGRDVESIIKDLVEVAVNLVKQQRTHALQRYARAEANAFILTRLFAADADQETKTAYLKFIENGDLDEATIELDIPVRAGAAHGVHSHFAGVESSFTRPSPPAVAAPAVPTASAGSEATTTADADADIPTAATATTSAPGAVTTSPLSVADAAAVLSAASAQGQAQTGYRTSSSSQQQTGWGGLFGASHGGAGSLGAGVGITGSMSAFRAAAAAASGGGTSSYSGHGTESSGGPGFVRRTLVTVRDARHAFEAAVADSAADAFKAGSSAEEISAEAVRAVEDSGVVFIDEIDKVCVAPETNRTGADASDEGVQRDLLPIIEGSVVSTPHGNVKTDHILFIASGAFHAVKPSALLPELQGRLPIRVTLEALTEGELYRVLTEPRHNLLTQQTALVGTEGIELRFDDTAIRAMARAAAELNKAHENIGARRLHAVVERVVEELSFSAAEMEPGASVVVTEAAVQEKVAGLFAKRDLSRYLL